MKKGLQNMALRSLAAEDGFVATLMTLGDLTESEAEHVFAVYRRLKVLKFDIVNAKITVKHGAFLDRDVIRNALREKA